MALCGLLSKGANAQNIANQLNTWRSLLSNQSYSLAVYQDFLNNRGHWPQIGQIEFKGEQALLTENPPQTVQTQWFKQHDPQTDAGRLAYVANLYSRGRVGSAQAKLRDYWHQGLFDSIKKEQILAKYPYALSAADHKMRLDSLLWQNNIERVRTNLHLLRGADLAVVQARLALRANASNAAQLIAALPRSVQKDSGLLFDRAQRFRQRGDNIMAAKILAQYSVRNDDPHAADWWLERHILARRAIEAQDYRAAYNLVVAHGLSTHKNQLTPYAEAEWLAGWLALRLGFADRAFVHFQNFYHHVETPMSKSRAAYWAGYALQVGGDNTQAKGWYEQAAQHPQTFYGQIAAQSLGEGTQKISSFWQRQARGNAANLPQDLVQAVQYLKQTNQTEDAKKFIIALGAWALNNKQIHAFNSFCATQNMPNACLRFNKDAQKDGVVDAQLLFPTMALPPQAGLEGALALGIVRQESVFDPAARSPVGALGLMQLMPATAAQTAQKIGVAHQTAWLVSKPTHNVQLGQAYLHQMLERFDGSLPLAVAAYNAGPSNVDKWLVSVGDPRVGRGVAQNDWVNWIEQIPFPETRNYVQRVWEAYAVYSNKP